MQGIKRDSGRRESNPHDLSVNGFSYHFGFRRLETGVLLQFVVWALPSSDRIKLIGCSPSSLYTFTDRYICQGFARRCLAWVSKQGVHRIWGILRPALPPAHSTLPAKSVASAVPPRPGIMRYYRVAPHQRQQGVSVGEGKDCTHKW